MLNQFTLNRTQKTIVLAMLLITSLVLSGLVLFKFEPRNVAYASSSNVHIFVDQGIYGGISSSLNQYKDDITSEGYNVTIHNVTESTPPDSIRQTLANDSSTVGCVLVGHTPVVWCAPNGNVFSTDFYFMDLDGTWSDTNGDGMFDTHTNGTGNVQPEIWCGRIKGWGANETSQINSYFTKLHKLRTGQLVLPQNTLLYYDDDWASWGGEAVDFFKKYYDSITMVNNTVTTNATDYKTRLTQTYESIDLACHGANSAWDGWHTFKINGADGGTVSGSDYLSIDPKSFFIDFYVCYAARHTIRNWDGTTSDAPYYLAGSWIFAPTYGLAALGSTYSGGLSGGPDDFYGPFMGGGACIGEAFRQWVAKNGEAVVWGYPMWHMALIGDPTLKKPVVTMRAQDQLGNDLAKGDVYLDSLLYAYTNSTIRPYAGNHTLRINDFWYVNSTSNNTGYRLTFDHWDNNSTSRTRNTTIIANQTFTAYFTKKWCPGDVNGDSTVDIYDAIIISSAFGKHRGDSGWRSDADLVHDGIIDTYDSLVVAANMGHNY